MKTILLFFSIMLFQNATAQNIYFSDANFKAKLLSSSSNNYMASNQANENVPIDLNNDNEISVSEALNIVSLGIVGDNITNLQGLQFFTNLKNLYFDTDFISDFNLSGLVNLESLTIGNFFVANKGICTNLDISDSINLEFLDIQTGALTTLDLSNNINLIEVIVKQEEPNLVVNFNGLVNLRKLRYGSMLSASLDLSPCINLLEVGIVGAGFSAIDLSNSDILIKLGISGTNISTIDLSNNQNLEQLGLNNNNQLQNLNLENNSYISSLNLSGNNLTSLNVNNLFLLDSFNCSNNQLTDLYIKNNRIETSIILNNNPNLNYVCSDANQVVLVQNNLNLSGIYNVVVNANCSTGSPLAINNFDESLEISLFPNPTSGLISFNTVSKIDKIEIYDLNGRKVIENKNTGSINVEQLQNGFYFAKAYFQNNSKTMKFLKN